MPRILTLYCFFRHKTAARALISIKAAAAKGCNIYQMEDIGEIFARDHRRLEEALDASTAYVGAAQWDAAAAAFAEFRRGIEQHMEIEEQELFPAVEGGGGETALTTVLRKGHRDLRVFFDELDDALEAHDVEEFGRIAGTMRALLARHDEKEEAELYPAAQARLGEHATAVSARLGES
jgi:hemerythrin-like domain-containing protein